jgi:carbon-monoxide dehydrogenase medium subunit
VAVNACLVQMASQVGSAQIRNMARLPGNIANASPGGDAVPALIALDAAALVLDGSGMTTVRRVDEVVTGIGRTTLRTGEAIIGVRIPRPGPDQRSAFGKIGMGARTRVVIANVSLTLVLEVDPAQGRIQDARVVLGSAAPVAFHARTAEALLKGRRPDPALAGDLAGTLRAEVKASIQEIAIFQHKLNDIQGLALDLFAQLFPGEQ